MSISLPGLLGMNIMGEFDPWEPRVWRGGFAPQKLLKRLIATPITAT